MIFLMNPPPAEIIRLIDQSLLLSEENKKKLKLRLGDLGKKKLTELRQHLETENKILIDTLGDILKTEWTENPKTDLPARLKKCFGKFKKKALKTRESTEKKKEEIELRALENQINTL